MVYRIAQTDYNKTLTIIIGICLSISFIGCAAIKETAKGIAGVSTDVLEKNRKDATKKTFPYDYNTCYSKAKETLEKSSYSKAEEKLDNSGSYIYCQDRKKNLLAIYVSEEDTTPVGIFFTEIDKTHTQIEVSSASTYAKELISGKVFKALSPGEEKGKSDAKK